MVRAEFGAFLENSSECGQSEHGHQGENEHHSRPLRDARSDGDDDRITDQNADHQGWGEHPPVRAADPDGVTEKVEQACHQKAGHEKEIAFKLVFAEPVDPFHGFASHQP